MELVWLEQPNFGRIHPLDSHRLLGSAKENFLYTLIPALLMTTVCSTFLFVSNQAFGQWLPENVGYAIGIAFLIVAVIWFTVWYRKFQRA